MHLGGPYLIPLSDGKLVLGTPLQSAKAKTILGHMSLDGNVTDVIELPSAGDNSYPGLVIHDEKLWVSYYSSHEGNASIYLATVKLPL